LSVVTLNVMKAKPKDIKGLITWICNSRDTYGGICLSPNTPDVSVIYTYWAIRILELIGGDRCGN